MDCNIPMLQRLVMIWSNPEVMTYDKEDGSHDVWRFRELNQEWYVSCLYAAISYESIIISGKVCQFFLLGTSKLVLTISLLTSLSRLYNIGLGCSQCHITSYNVNNLMWLSNDWIIFSQGSIHTYNYNTDQFPFVMVCDKQ